MKQIIDFCALCGRKTEMTFEHIPPRSAFNSLPAKPVNGNDLIEACSETEKMPWDTTGVRYQNLQQGLGLWSLCAGCNAKTGAWYGAAYSDFANRIGYIIQEHKIEAGKMLSLEIKDIYPLRIVKQMISMICSINQGIFVDSIFRDLAEFVLNKYKVGLDPNKYEIRFYFALAPIAKFCPYTTLFKCSNNETELFIENVSECYAFPIGVVIYFNPEKTRKRIGTDITNFCNYDYDAKCSGSLDALTLEANTIFPTDYRKREEFAKPRTEE